MNRPNHRMMDFLRCVGFAAIIFCLVQGTEIFAQFTDRPTLRFTPPVLSTTNESNPSVSNPNVSNSPDTKVLFRASDENTLPADHTLTKLRRSGTLPALQPAPYATQRPVSSPLKAPQFTAPRQITYNEPPGNAHSNAAKFVPIQEPPLQLQPVQLQPIQLQPVQLQPVQQAQPMNQEELDLVIRHGTELETEARWMDVLNHYDTALQVYRNNDVLLDRYRVARFHYDVSRRFHDSSYLDIVYKSGFIETLNFYEKIISCIQDDYIDAPNWDMLFRHGVQDFDIALFDPGFRNRAQLNVPPEKIDAYHETMRQTANGWEIRNREDLKNGILRLAEIAQQQIGLNPTITLMEFTCGIINSLDRYTTYLTPNQLTEQFSLISGNLVGLGVELKSDRESLLIVRVIQGSPAQEGGLKDGDRILSVDGISTKGRDTDSAADLLQGAEGSIVRLLIKSGMKPAREIQITRRQIEVPSVEDVRMLNNYLGYIKLTGFQSKTAEEMKAALIDLDRQGMRCLVLDMRRNPGGLLQVGIEVANLFLDNGAIVRIRGRKNNSDHTYMATQENTWKVPLIVFIDEESASASEIVAEAIRDHKRGVIIGKRSYGKGTIQQILPINAGMANNTKVGLKLTIEKFYSPLGWSCSGVGVSPDIPVEQSENRWNVARLIEGKVQIPVISNSVSSDLNDPFIRQAMNKAKELVPNRP